MSKETKHDVLEPLPVSETPDRIYFTPSYFAAMDVRNELRTVPGATSDFVYVNSKAFDELKAQLDEAIEVIGALLDGWDHWADEGRMEKAIGTALAFQRNATKEP